MTVETGHFAVLRRSFGRISEDQRVQAVIIAFCFGALLEALAGFGTPVAITAVMLIAARVQADQGGLDRPRREHRAGRLRRDRDPDHDAVRDHRARQGRPRRDGRSPDAVPRADRAADPDRHGRRAARRQADLAGGRRRRPHLRARPVRVLELHLGRADRHRRLAARRRRRSSRCSASGQPGEPLLAEDTAPAGRARRSPAPRSSDPAMEREITRRDDTRQDPRWKSCAPTRPT